MRKFKPGDRVLAKVYYHGNTIKSFAATIADHINIPELKNELSFYPLYECYFILFDDPDNAAIAFGFNSPVEWTFKPYFLTTQRDLELLDSNGSIDNAELKLLNSVPAAVNCARCGNPLKKVGQFIKYCPVCEP